MSQSYQGNRQSYNGARRPPPVPARRHPSLPPLKARAEMTERGHIKFYDRARGFGFIRREEGEDVFLHSSIVAKYGINDHQLEPDVPVQFTSIPNTMRAGQKADALCIVG